MTRMLICSTTIGIRLNAKKMQRPSRPSLSITSSCLRFSPLRVSLGAKSFSLLLNSDGVDNDHPVSWVAIDDVFLHL